MSKRIIKKCRNNYCRQKFGVIKLIKDKNGEWKAKCPFCKSLNKLNTGELKKLIIKILKSNEP